MMVCCLMVLLQVVAPSVTAKRGYNEKAVIIYAKALAVVKLDETLPSQRLDEWLRSGPAHLETVTWHMSRDCGLNPPESTTLVDDRPLCARFDFKRGHVGGWGVITVGTLAKGISGPPRLEYLTVLWEPARKKPTRTVTGNPAKLSDLPLLLDEALSGSAAVVRQLYSQVVLRHPLGIPYGDDKVALWPFLSKGLIQRLDTALACQTDYDRQQGGYDPYPNDPDHHLPPVILKPAFGWLESGLFSGENEAAVPAAVDVERTEPQKDGTFRVYVRFTYQESFETYRRAPSPENTFHWHGAAVVISEDGRFVVDDILLFKDESTKVESRLSHRFRGCDGPRWMGYRR